MKTIFSIIGKFLNVCAQHLKENYLFFLKRNCDKPRLIEALKTKRIRDIACGSSHSAAITSSGELYSWGLGEYGRLGHGDNTTQLRPKLVSLLQLPFLT